MAGPARCWRWSPLRREVSRWRWGLPTSWSGFGAARGLRSNMAPMDLSVVVPAYREGEHIYDNLRQLLGELDHLGCQYEVVVVSDGNTDGTAAEARRVGSDRVRVLDYDVNMGKGFALAHGVRRCKGELVTFIDADMELSPREIRNFIEVMEPGR